MTTRLALGVDLGTTYTCAAAAEPGRVVRIMQLTGTSQTIPSVVSVTDDGLLAGEAAERRLVTHPADTAREFKRRLGDPTPMVLGGRAIGADELTGALLAEVVRRAEQHEGRRPDVVGLAHPASWGPFRLDVLRDAARHAGVDDAVLVPEPVAAAIANQDRVEPGSLVAVYDLGGGTFDAALVRMDDEPVVVGTPEGVERLGGIDFDQALLAHVDAAVGGQVFTLDRSDDAARSALMRLRAECQTVKEHLSQDTDAEIAVSLPSVQTSIRVTRAEFESMVRPRLDDSLAALDRVVSSAGAEWADVSAVLLVGGSSNMPIVGQLVSERTGRPVISSTSPHLAIAAGSARVALASGSIGRADDEPDPMVGATVVEDRGVDEQIPVAPGAASSSGERSRSGRSIVPLVAAAFVVVAAVIVAVVFLGNDGDGDADDVATPASTTLDDEPGEGPGATGSDDGEPQAGSVDDADPAGAIAQTESPETTESSPRPEIMADATECASLDTASVGVGITDAGIVVVTPDASVIVEGVTADDCGFDPASGSPFDTQLASPPAAVSSVGDLIAIGASDGGIVLTTDVGEPRPCALITSPMAMNSAGVIFPIADDGSVGRIRTRGANCSAQDASAFAGITATAVGVNGADDVAIGGILDGVLTLRIFADEDDFVDARSDEFVDGLGSIDAVAACDGRWCLLDLTDLAVHVVDGDGAHRGTTPFDAGPLAGTTAVRSAVPSTDGPALFTVERSDGTVALVAVQAS